MHPDDEREYMAEIDGSTRWDDMNERYGDSAVDYYPEWDNPPLTRWQRLKGKFTAYRFKIMRWWQSRNEEEIPF
jgi:hypothetical protein